MRNFLQLIAGGSANQPIGERGSPVRRVVFGLCFGLCGPGRFPFGRFSFYSGSFFGGLFQALIAILLFATIANVFALAPDANSGTALGARYLSLKGKLDHSPFQRPLAMESTESNDSVSGEIHAVFNHPFTDLGAALSQPARWCDILIMHLNTKYCRPSNQSADGGTSGPQTTVLNVAIGKKHDQPVSDAFQVNFVYRVIANRHDFLQVRLNAETGPLSTHNYRIVLEAVPLENGKSFIHLAYSYDFGFSGRLAMQAYLGTIGRSKVGFTVIGQYANGQPQYVGGMRGLVERNTIRYYLAIESFMDSLSAPAATRIEKSLRSWYVAVERYPLQLHEIGQDEYLDMKRKEYRRQQTEVPAVIGFVPAH